MSPRTQIFHRTPAGRRHPLVVRRIALGTTGAVLAGVGMFIGVTSAAAAVPSFPDNLLVFPNRDFVSIQGYSEHAGQTALVEVTRPQVGVVGSSYGKVSGGDVAFEVNHPGGVCWGANTNLKVTPDILPGDVVSISFNGQRAGETTVADAYVTARPTVNGNTLTVTGHIAAGVNPANAEQRIIQPEYRTTAINRRDIRAIPGPLATAPLGGYASQLEFSGDTFTATYVFDDPAMAQLGADAALGPRLMSWQEVDLAGNRQGLTIAEFGEPGGPGMGGCPNGPLQSGPAGPTGVRAVAVANGVKLTWTPAVAVAGTKPILGYRVTAVGQSANTAGEQTAIQVRIPQPGATGTTISNFVPNETYRLEVESVSDVGVTMPALTPDIEIDSTPPVMSASPHGGSFRDPQTVTLTSNEAGTDIYYTVDGTDPLPPEGLSPAAIHYAGPISITADSTLQFVGYDLAGNVSQTGSEVYTFAVNPPPTAPTITGVTPGNSSATVTWTGDPSATGFAVQVYKATGAVGQPLVPDPATATSLVVTGLTPDVAYTFSVSASNANGTSPASATSAPVTPQGSAVANAGPDQTVARAIAPPTVTLTGAGSTIGAGVTYTWEQLKTGTTTVSTSTTDPDYAGVLTGSSTLSAGFKLPLYKAGMTNNPLTFRLTVTSAGIVKTDVVLVTPKSDQVQFATAKWKLGDFRITGGGSVAGATVTLRRGSATGPVLATAILAAAVAPATGGTFDIRIRSTGAPFNTNPGPIWIDSNLGGVAGPFTVSN
ncbi:MAG: fibronectin type III domain-containing protein [Nakamurella sp.]